MPALTKQQRIRQLEDQVEGLTRGQKQLYEQTLNHKAERARALKRESSALRREYEAEKKQRAAEAAQRLTAEILTELGHATVQRVDVDWTPPKGVDLPEQVDSWGDPIDVQPLIRQIPGATVTITIHAAYMPTDPD